MGTSWLSNTYCSPMKDWSTFLLFSLGNKIPPVNLVKREALLKALYMSHCILFPIENFKNCTSVLIFILCDKITLQNYLDVSRPVSVSLSVVNFSFTMLHCRRPTGEYKYCPVKLYILCYFPGQQSEAIPAEGDAEVEEMDGQESESNKK